MEKNEDNGDDDDSSVDDEFTYIPTQPVVDESPEKVAKKHAEVNYDSTTRSTDDDDPTPTPRNQKNSRVLHEDATSDESSSNGVATSHYSKKVQRSLPPAKPLISKKKSPPPVKKASALKLKTNNTPPVITPAPSSKTNRKHQHSVFNKIIPSHPTIPLRGPHPPLAASGPYGYAGLAPPVLPYVTLPPYHASSHGPPDDHYLAPYSHLSFPFYPPPHPYYLQAHGYGTAHQYFQQGHPPAAQMPVPSGPSSSPSDSDVESDSTDTRRFKRKQCKKIQWRDEDCRRSF